MTWFDDMACDECLLDYITQVCGDVARSFEVVGGDAETMCGTSSKPYK